MAFYPLLFGHIEGPDPSELPARPARYQLAELQPERTASVALRLRQTLKRFR
jgi:hypothetical protein